MPRRQLVWAAIVAVIAGASLLAVAATDQRERAFAVGPVPPHGVAAELAPGQTACQGPIDVAAPATDVRLVLGAPAGSGPPLRLTIRDLDAGGGVIADAAIEGGYGDGASPTASIPELEEGGLIELCLQNTGSGPADLYGSLPPDDRPPYADRPAPNSSQLEVPRAGGENVLSIDFLRAEPASALSLVPEIFTRASLFRPGWVGAWTFWILLAALLVGVPALLGRSLAAAVGDDPAPDGTPAAPDGTPGDHART